MEIIYKVTVNRPNLRDSFWINSNLFFQELGKELENACDDIDADFVQDPTKGYTENDLRPEDKDSINDGIFSTSFIPTFYASTLILTMSMDSIEKLNQVKLIIEKYRPMQKEAMLATNNTVVDQIYIDGVLTEEILVEP